MSELTIIGAGLAGAEAAWQAANRGVQVKLIEMRPVRSTPAHKTALFAELVCSNSLRGASLDNAVGVLKEEMRRLDSLIMQAADATKLPAGGALAVDRTLFSQYITERLIAHPNVEIEHREVTSLDELSRPLIIASGPLTDGALADEIKKLTGGDSFYFYDAAAPIVTAESIDFTRAFRASRYDKGGDDAYINCPMDHDTYHKFRQALIHAEKAPTHEFEQEIFFEGCLPIEVLASRGKNTMRFGPMKPVGLIDPSTNETPFAVVQLRQDNREATLYNIVGFQTHLTWGEQRRVFSMIPGLEHLEIVRYGVMHRNTYINSPRVLLPTFQLRAEPSIMFAGQITGVEGYVESAASGLIAGINGARLVGEVEPIIFPSETCHGALAHYITTADEENFQPMNINFGLLPPVSLIISKRDRKARTVERALKMLPKFTLQ